MHSLAADKKTSLTNLLRTISIKLCWGGPPTWSPLLRLSCFCLGAVLLPVGFDVVEDACDLVEAVGALFGDTADEVFGLDLELELGFADVPCLADEPCLADVPCLADPPEVKADAPFCLALDPVRLADDIIQECRNRILWWVSSCLCLFQQLPISNVAQTWE